MKNRIILCNVLTVVLCVLMSIGLMEKMSTSIYGATDGTDQDPEVKFWDDKDVIDISWYKKNPDAKIFKIYTAEELGGLSYLVNGFYEDAVSFEGCNILMCNNIDLSGKYWTPIGTDRHPFKGNFDGQGFVVSNMKCDTSLLHPEYTGAGLFGYINEYSNDGNN